MRLLTTAVFVTEELTETEIAELFPPKLLDAGGICGGLPRALQRGMPER